MTKDSTGIAERFAIILNILSEHEKVKISKLEELTGESRRTLQKDLNERLKWIFSIETDGRGSYWIDNRNKYLFTANEIRVFSRILGTAGVLPENDSRFLKELIDSSKNNPFIIKSPFEENIKSSEEFKIVSESIENSLQLLFRYNSKSYKVSPYKMLNVNGHWYLCGTDGDKIKTFRFNRITGLRSCRDSFKSDDSVLKIIEKSDSIWITKSETLKAVLRVKADFSRYFTDNIKLNGIYDTKVEADGSLIIKLEVPVFEELKNIIKYWMPNIQVIDPLELRNIITTEVKTWLDSSL